ncbi:rod shape-determining protein MreC [candidate division KSB1 bacterium]
MLTLRVLLIDISSKFTTPLNSVVEIFDALEENRALTEENIRLNHEISMLRNREKVISSLREMLSLKERTEFDLKFGRIIQWGSIPVPNTVTINLGENDGVKKNDPVISKKGLVGKIIEAGRNSSLCQLFTDRNFKVSAITKNPEAFGILQWKQDNIAEMQIHKSSIVAVGDTVTTSEHGNIYPEGIPIGIVDSFEEGPGLFKNVEVKLFVDYLQLKDIAVIVEKEY